MMKEKNNPNRSDGRTAAYDGKTKKKLYCRNVRPNCTMHILVYFLSCIPLK